MPDPSQPPEARPGLDLIRGGNLDRAIRNELDRMQLDSILANSDSSVELMRDIEQQAASASLAIADINAIERIAEPAAQAFRELETVLAAPEAHGLDIDSNVLSDLLKEGAESKQMILKGLTLAKHRQYPLAVEWWTLNRASLDPKSSRLFLLLLIMESLTWFWAGQPERAKAVGDQVRAHPIILAAGHGRLSD